MSSGIPRAKTWVIGGTSGIGASTAMLLESYGHETYVSDEKQCDVTSVFALERYIDALPAMDNVVFCAGINHMFHLGKGDYSTYAKVIDVNLIGFINLLNALAAASKYAGQSDLRVVAVTSDAAVRPLRTSIAYCASKAGLSMAIRCAAREMAARGWRVNGVAPGMTEPTGMTTYIDATVPELRGWSREETLRYERSQEVVAGRIDPIEVAMVIADILAWPTHFNGEIVTINGGR